MEKIILNPRMGISLIACTLFVFVFLFSSCKNQEQEVVPEKLNIELNSKNSQTTVSNIRKKVMHLNICGNVCWDDTDPESGGVDSRGSTSRMTRILTAIDNYLPHIVTFNEICYSQYKAIQDDLATRGYESTYASTTTAGGCDNYDASYGQGFGNAIFFKGSVPDTQQKYVLPNSSTAEPRHLLCTDVVLDGKAIKVCTTHLSNELSWRQQQIDYIVAKAATWISTKPVIITGDFNAVPTSAEMGKMYSHSGGTGLFQEADESHSCTSPLTFCRGGEYTFSEIKKIDYIFFSAQHFGGMEGDAKSRFPNPFTDHNTLQGSALWQ